MCYQLPWFQESQTELEQSWSWVVVNSFRVPGSISESLFFLDSKAVKTYSLIPGPSTPPVFDCLLQVIKSWR